MEGFISRLNVMCYGILYVRQGMSRHGASDVRQNECMSRPFPFFVGRYVQINNRTTSLRVQNHLIYICVRSWCAASHFDQKIRVLETWCQRPCTPQECLCTKTQRLCVGRVPLHEHLSSCNKWAVVSYWPACSTMNASAFALALFLGFKKPILPTFPTPFLYLPPPLLNLLISLRPSLPPPTTRKKLIRLPGHGNLFFLLLPLSPPLVCLPSILSFSILCLMLDFPRLQFSSYRLYSC